MFYVLAGLFFILAIPVGGYAVIQTGSNGAILWWPIMWGMAFLFGWVGEEAGRT